MALPKGPKQDLYGKPPPAELSGSDWAAAAFGAPYTWQAPLLDVLTGAGRPRVAYVQVPRKNGKSFLAAAVALKDMCAGRQVFLIADSERNLKSALFAEINKLVNGSRVLSNSCHLYKDHVECPSSGGGIFLRPNNLSASQSINPDTVLFDEVHMQRSDSVWNGMLLAGAASRDGLLLGITTPGYETVSLAHDLYEQTGRGEIYGKLIEASLHWDLRDPDQRARALVEANPVLTERPDMMDVFELEFSRMPEHDFRRFRLGQWTETAVGWLPAGAWDACRSDDVFDTTARCWLGFDGSYSGDSTGLVAVNALGQVCVLGVWERPTGTAGNGWRVPRVEVDEAVRRAFRHLNVVALIADPPYWQKELQEWERDFPRRVFEFSTASAARMAPACTEFYTAVVEGRVRDCTPEGSERRALAAHLSHCVSKQTPSGTVITKQKDWSPKKIDLAVATVVAWSQVQTARPQRTRMVL